MNDLAVVICNYNKKDFVKKCVESLQVQTKKDFDIIIVDNASTDGSAEEFKNLYGDNVKLICNNENLGGSGGFNTGLRAAMQEHYKYMVLLDNDVILHEDCLSVLCNDMDENTNIGILGAKILKMDFPDTIQEFGPVIDYNRMTFILENAGDSVSIDLPHIKKCDYVPACALIVRREVVEKIGCMPQENFIYYDDISWGVRCTRAGYDVAADSKAVVWHKGGAKVNPSTFGNYYLARNKTFFFMSNADRCCSLEDKNALYDLAGKITYEIFQGIYTCANNGMPNIAKTRFEGFMDALNNVKGKGPDSSIRPKEYQQERLESLLKGKKRVILYTNDCIESTRRILIDIGNYEKSEDVVIEKYLVGKSSEGENTLLGIPFHSEKPLTKEDTDTELSVCNHIYEAEISKLDRIWVDRWSNVIVTDKDFQVYKNYENAYNLFDFCFRDRVIECIKKYSEDEIKAFSGV